MTAEPRGISPCPECAVGKCGNCSGETWDMIKDEPTKCPCSHGAREVRGQLPLPLEVPR